MKRKCNVAGLFIIGCSFYLYSANVNVTTNADNGDGSLRQAIMDINSGSDSSNTINMQIPGNSFITLDSDLSVIKKNTEITSNGQQTINGNGQYRLFATIMADLTLTNCTLQNGAAIGGNGGTFAGGGMGAGGGVYIDRGSQLTLTAVTINNCKSQGGRGSTEHVNQGNGGGASFSSANKEAQPLQGEGDYPGVIRKSSGGTGAGGEADGSSYMNGYGGGKGLAIREMGGYCGGGAQLGAGGGDNGGAAGNYNRNSREGGGFGSGGADLGGGGRIWGRRSG